MNIVYNLNTYGRKDIEPFGYTIDTYYSIGDAHQKSMIEMQRVFNKYKLDNKDIFNGNSFVKSTHIDDLKIRVSNEATGDFTVIYIDKKQIK